MRDINREAKELLERALQEHMAGNLQKAIEFYQKSIELQPTAEAYTYMGWAYSMMGELETAIDLCLKAIDIDPGFGNPYNDIGSYLIAMGRLDEALPWLKKAITAPRYEPRHYPHINLARLYMMKGKFQDALIEVENAVKLAPDYKPSHVLRHQILSMLN
ncbi:MAG: tetratricopeptide repeat protein [Aquificaceae bacterium]|nr:tetratricopeptide repeat protein [Aquificaceae bacterium]MCX8059937.1 tetratricopeptide repeat protein [Aquificaceae bacterium]MDW8096901.1 tetratricopeptide repeat protein [Aquificaceae bacterium]